MSFSQDLACTTNLPAVFSSLKEESAVINVTVIITQVRCKLKRNIKSCFSKWRPAD
jgi:hypothetical protein